VKKIVLVVNNPDFLISHRLQVCIAAKNAGYAVHIISPFKPSVVKFSELDFSFHELDFGRNRSNPFSELKTIYLLTSLFKSIQPDLIHLITIKPYLYGGIAARFAGITAVVSAVAGLGILFSSSQFKYRLLRLGLYPLFKFAFGHKNQNVIFQNAEDCNALVDWGVVNEDQVRMIRGSGVDLSTCPVLPEPSDIPIVSFAARLLKDKGVEVFVEASRLLKQRGVKVRFWLIGEPDAGNANSVTSTQLDQWESEGLVELFGFRKDIPDLFSQSNIVTLPSFYGEGLPKVLIEAAACGRAVITTDHPGCRDAIEPDLTGVLVPVRDEHALASAIKDLIKNPDKRKAMGKAGRELAEKEFAIEKVVDAHLKIYEELMRGKGFK
jgi:glycosyltransferase involved in cell wall biosynthesis